MISYNLKQVYCGQILSYTYILVGGLEHFLFFYILGIIIPADFHIFQRGRSTTNQYSIVKKHLITTITCNDGIDVHPIPRLFFVFCRRTYFLQLLHHLWRLMAGKLNKSGIILVDGGLNRFGNSSINRIYTWDKWGKVGKTMP